MEEKENEGEGEGEEEKSLCAVSSRGETLIERQAIRAEGEGSAMRVGLNRGSGHESREKRREERRGDRDAHSAGARRWITS